MCSVRALDRMKLIHATALTMCMVTATIGRQEHSTHTSLHARMQYVVTATIGRQEHSTHTCQCTHVCNMWSLLPLEGKSTVLIHLTALTYATCGYCYHWKAGAQYSYMSLHSRMQHVHGYCYHWKARAQYSYMSLHSRMQHVVTATIGRQEHGNDYRA